MKLHDRRHRLGRLREVVGHAEPEIAGVLEVPLGRALGELGARARRGVVDLVVDVGDVVDELRVVAGRLQPRAQPHADDERARVADVRARVHRRAADVHAHRPGSAQAARRASACRCRKAHGFRVVRARSASSRGSARSTAQSSGPRSRPVSATRNAFRLPPTAFSSRTIAFASSLSSVSGNCARSSTNRAERLGTL